MSSSHVKTWYGLIATVGGAGLIGKAPGTVGTAVAFICLLVMRGIPPLLLLGVIVLGTIASDRYAKATGKEDPGEVVIDEVAGFWVSVFALPATYAFIAFFLVFAGLIHHSLVDGILRERGHATKAKRRNKK